MVVREKTGGEPVLTKSLDAMSEQELYFFLARFIAEVRKQDGEEYPGKTIYEMISSIQGYLRKGCKRYLYRIDKKGSRFSTLNAALNNTLKERAKAGIGTDCKDAELITEEQINYLWENCYLGSNTAELLRDTLVFVLGGMFALRAGQEHRNLRMYNSQLSIQTDESGAEYLQYVEDIVKLTTEG